MSVVTDPYSGLQFVELSHVWDQGCPSYPGQADVIMFRSVKHAQHGVMANKIKTVMHTGTHMNAPIHLIQGGIDLAQIPVDHFFGNGAIVDIPKKAHEVITKADLENATPAIQEGDIVVIVTGWHHKYSDALEYFGEAPGLSKEAAEYLVSKKPKMVCVDTPHVDHPMATNMAPHRGGPHMSRAATVYKEATGLDPKAEHPEWNAAHKVILGAGIPTIEQVGGDVDVLKGKRATIGATPWKFEHGDACQVRMVAITDPEGKNKVEPGN